MLEQIWILAVVHQLGGHGDLRLEQVPHVQQDIRGIHFEDAAGYGWSDRLDGVDAGDRVRAPERLAW